MKDHEALEKVIVNRKFLKSEEEVDTQIKHETSAPDISKDGMKETEEQIDEKELEKEKEDNILDKGMEEMIVNKKEKECENVEHLEEDLKNKEENSEHFVSKKIESDKNREGKE